MYYNRGRRYERGQHGRWGGSEPSFRGEHSWPTATYDYWNDVQVLPVNFFETEEHGFMILAPMPGLEADDIAITVDGRHIILHGERRGIGQDRRDYLMREWTYGPFHREFDLPAEVDGQNATATFSNGVLTLQVPRSSRSRPHKIQLVRTGTSRGLGVDGRPLDTPETQERTANEISRQ